MGPGTIRRPQYRNFTVVGLAGVDECVAVRGKFDGSRGGQPATARLRPVRRSSTTPFAATLNVAGEKSPRTLGL